MDGVRSSAPDKDGDVPPDAAYRSARFEAAEASVVGFGGGAASRFPCALSESSGDG